MEPQKKWPVIAFFLIVSIPLTLAGCVTELSQIPRNTEPPPETVSAEEPKLTPPPAISPERAVTPPPRIEEDEVIASLPKPEPEETKGPLSASAPPGNQQNQRPSGTPKKIRSAVAGLCPGVLSGLQRLLGARGYG